MLDRGATKALYDFDEARYGEIAKNIVRSNDWFSMHAGYPDDISVSQKETVDFWKPPLQPMGIALSYKLFGINEFATRLPSLLFFCGTLIVLFLLLQKLFPDDMNTNVLIVFLFAALGDSSFIAHQGIAESQLLFFNLLAIYFFTKSHNNLRRCSRSQPNLVGHGDPDLRRDDSLYRLILAGAIWGLALLTKGFAAWWVPAILILFNFKFEILNFKLIVQRLILFLICGLVVALPWHWYMYVQFGKLFVDHYLLINTIGRSVGATANVAPFWWYGAWMVWNWRPVIFIVPLIVSRLLSFRLSEAHGEILRDPSTSLGMTKRTSSKTIIRIFFWFLIIIIPFSLIRSKVWWYIYPASIPLIILVVRVMKKNFLLGAILLLISLFPFWQMGAAPIKWQMAGYVFVMIVAIVLQGRIPKLIDKKIQMIFVALIIFTSLFISIPKSFENTDKNRDLKVLASRNIPLFNLSVYNLPYEAALFYFDSGVITKNNMHSVYQLADTKDQGALRKKGYVTIDREGERALMKRDPKAISD